MKLLHLQDWDTLAYWITAIATVGLFIVTGLLVFFAYKALDSWKTEIKEKNKYNLAKNLFNFILEFQSFTNNLHLKTYEEKQEYLNKIQLEIPRLNLEFKCLGFKQDELITEEDLQNMLNYYETNEKAADILYGNREKGKLIDTKINNLKEFCEKIIMDFYK